MTPADVAALLKANRPRRQAQEAQLRAEGLPAYTTSAGWLGYDDAKVRELCAEAVADGWSHIKMKVGRDHAADVRRAALMRDETIARMQDLRRFDPLWLEEPTSPDDILGHARIARAIDPIGVATGEHVHNRVMFKQFLQADAIRYCQIDSARLAGVNEVLAVLFMAQRFGVTVCPHAGGVGLSEYVQHLALFDAISVAPDVGDRVVEYVDHLHEHFVDPVRVENGRYVAPRLVDSTIDDKPLSVALREINEGKLTLTPFDAPE